MGTVGRMCIYLTFTHQSFCWKKEYYPTLILTSNNQFWKRMYFWGILFATIHDFIVANLNT
jgi:hypothetical protein